MLKRLEVLLMLAEEYEFEMPILFPPILPLSDTGFRFGVEDEIGIGVGARVGAGVEVREEIGVGFLD